MKRAWEIAAMYKLLFLSLFGTTKGALRDMVIKGSLKEEDLEFVD